MTSKTKSSGILLQLSTIILISACRTASSGDSSNKDYRLVSTDGAVEIIHEKNGLVYDTKCAEQNSDKPCECATSTPMNPIPEAQYLKALPYGNTGNWAQTAQGKKDLTEAVNDAEQAAKDNHKAAAELPQLKAYLANMEKMLVVKDGLANNCLTVRSFTDNFDILKEPFDAQKKSDNAAKAKDRATMRSCGATYYSSTDYNVQSITSDLRTTGQFNTAADAVSFTANENQVYCVSPALGSSVGLFFISFDSTCSMYPEVSSANQTTFAQAYVQQETIHVDGGVSRLYFFGPTNNGRVVTNMTTRISTNWPLCYQFRRIPVGSPQ